LGQYSEKLIATPVPDNINPYQARNSGALDSEKVLLVAVGSQVYKVGLDVYAPTHSESPEYDPKDPKIIELNNRKRQEKVETSCELSPPVGPPSLSLSLSLSLSPLAQQVSLTRVCAPEFAPPGCWPGGANSGQTPQATT